jgi:hypothetical protein
MTVARGRGVPSRALFAALLAAAFAPAGLRAQDDLRARVLAAYGPQAAERIDAVTERARRAGVPAEPLLEKALEGAAKRVPAERVLPVLAAYADRLQAAAALFDGPPDRHRLVAATDALRRGVPEAAVAGVVRSGNGAGPASLVVLADLVEAGVPVELARGMVEEAIARGGGPDALLDLPAAVQKHIRSGSNPGDAARAAAAAARTVPRGPPPGVGRGNAPGKPPVPPGQAGRGRRGGGG